jgi:small subunit ribosomal protein S17
MATPKPTPKTAAEKAPSAPKAVKAPVAKAPAAKAAAPKASKASKTVKAAHAHAGAKRASKTPPSPLAKDLKGTKTGVVESDKRPQTRRVVVAYASKHPKYGKYIRQRTVLHVHDDKSESRVGDVVEVAPCRPFSKSKTWRLVKVVERRSELAAALASAKAIGEAKD